MILAMRASGGGWEKASRNSEAEMGTAQLAREQNKTNHTAEFLIGVKLNKMRAKAVKKWPADPTVRTDLTVY